MLEWILTGILLVRLWAPRVGVMDAMRGCAWVIVRKALPRQTRLARYLMPHERTLALQIPGHAHPFYARWPASDLHIVYTIIERKEYAPMADYLDRDAEMTFLDLGANIGAASRYMLETFPRAKVIAVEPGAENVAMCHKNLDPYGERARIIHAAAWNHNTRLVFEADSTGTGTEAGIRVREPEPGEYQEGSVAAMDIPTLLLEAGDSPGTQIAMKIDVEGSEADIFSGENLDWLDGITCIAIELHDSVRENCSRNFYSAIEGRANRPAVKLGDTVFVILKEHL